MKTATVTEQRLSPPSTTLTTKAGQTESTTDRTDFSKTKLVNYLFKTFKTYWPTRYAARFPTTENLQEVKRAWLSDLPSLSPAAVKIGLRRCHRELSWPPDMSEFLERCQVSADDLGVPHVRTAYREACNRPSPKHSQKWSHEIIYFVGSEVGWHFLSTTSERFAFPVFREVYQSTVEKWRRGERPERLESESPAKKIKQMVTSREESLEKLQEIKTLLNFN